VIAAARQISPHFVLSDNSCLFTPPAWVTFSHFSFRRFKKRRFLRIFPAGIIVA